MLVQPTPIEYVMQYKLFLCTEFYHLLYSSGVFKWTSHVNENYGLRVQTVSEKNIQCDFHLQEKNEV